jgi:NAD(P)-dependent dehydrogenase (short-subunit alcohol dehydrogenase family)
LFDFARRVLLLTGGIGWEIARLFTESGAKFVMAKIGLRGAEEFVRSVDSAGDYTVAVKLDASSASGLRT